MQGYAPLPTFNAIGVKLVLEAVCILKGIKASRVKDTNSGKMVDDYWESSKKMLMDSDFLQSLRVYDKDNIPVKIIEKIRPYVANPEFEPNKILQASKAAYGLCCWVRAMEAYDRVAKVVEPKKQKLAESEAELEVSCRKLEFILLVVGFIISYLGVSLHDLGTRRQ